MQRTARIRVLVVDDSALERRAFELALRQDPRLEVVGTAADAYSARDRILELRPDVLTLDIQMPGMDGLSFLRVLQQHYPLPVVIVSSLTQEGSQLMLDAFALGAVDVLSKEPGSQNNRSFSAQLAERVVAAARARVANCNPRTARRLTLRRGIGPQAPSNQPRLVLIGSSTGGTEALRHVLTRLPAGLPGICIVQHFPPLFSRSFAERLNGTCAFEVREAAHNDLVRPGLALIAPGDYHMSLRQEGGSYRVQLSQEEPVNYVRPAVDVLFESVARCREASSVAVLLTGMGKDGAEGMAKLKARGAVTLAQNEATCVVYGMPRAAAERGVVDHLLPLEKIPNAILQALQLTEA